MKLKKKYEYLGKQYEMKGEGKKKKSEYSILVWHNKNDQQDVFELHIVS